MRFGVLVTMGSAAGLGACAGAPSTPVIEVGTPPTPLPEHSAQIVMEGERLFPESITSDSRGTLYISSNPGTIFRAFAGEDVAKPWIVPDAENGLQALFGVLVDEARSLLWVCSNPAMGSADSPAIKTFALADGQFVFSYPLAIEGAAMCNDMAVATNGDVFASETLGGRILRLRVGGRQFELWAQSELFASLDGIAFGPGGDLYANAIQRNRLLRVHQDETGAFLRAEDLETSAPLDAPDGLRPLDHSRMLQSEGNGGTITVLTFDGDAPVQVEVIAEGIDYASSVTEWNGRAFYPEGKLSFLFGPQTGEDPGTFLIRSAVIPEAK